LEEKKGKKRKSSLKERTRGEREGKRRFASPHAKEGPCIPTPKEKGRKRAPPPTRKKKREKGKKATPPVEPMNNRSMQRGRKEKGGGPDEYSSSDFLKRALKLTRWGGKREKTRLFAHQRVEGKKKKKGGSSQIAQRRSTGREKSPGVTSSI